MVDDYYGWLDLDKPSLFTVCDVCVEDYSPSQFGDKCTLCEENEYLHPEAGCKKCSDHVEHLGRCDFDLEFYPL